MDAVLPLKGNYMSIWLRGILNGGELTIARACNMLGDVNLLFSQNRVLHRK